MIGSLNGEITERKLDGGEGLRVESKKPSVWRDGVMPANPSSPDGDAWLDSEIATKKI